jgi:hypothetical protein
MYAPVKGFLLFTWIQRQKSKVEDRLVAVPSQYMILVGACDNTMATRVNN